MKAKQNVQQSKRPRATKKAKKAKVVPYAVQMENWKAEVAKSLGRMAKQFAGIHKSLDDLDKAFAEADAEYEKDVEERVDKIVRKLTDDDSPGEPEMAPAGSSDDAAELGSPEDL